MIDKNMLVPREMLTVSSLLPVPAMCKRHKPPFMASPVLLPVQLTGEAEYR